MVFYTESVLVAAQTAHMAVKIHLNAQQQIKRKWERLLTGLSLPSAVRTDLNGSVL